MIAGVTWFTNRFDRILLPMKKFSVLLVDDHRILLEGMISLIQEPFFTKETASSGEEALRFIKSTDFDVMITDYEMPGITGLELVKAARAAQPEMKIIMLSMHDDPSVVREVLKTGVLGYVLKKDTHKSLTEALTKVIEGKRFLSDEIAEILIHQPMEEEKGVLTSREIEILRLVAKEFSSRQIAEILFISERTVETHRKNILKKTGASNLVGLIKYAYANNLI
ncbi:MAG: response regulator transcription factor [Bacteroidetes bacterium]|nr:response regulator transcription factor [Bacteroidota bacterium]